jgi:hypothetical protein
MMKHLVLDYKSKIETLKKDTIESLRHEQNQSVKDLFFILTGKLFAYDECLKEIDRLLKYNDEFAKH